MKNEDEIQEAIRHLITFNEMLIERVEKLETQLTALEWQFKVIMGRL